MPQFQPPGFISARPYDEISTPSGLDAIFNAYQQTKAADRQSMVQNAQLAGQGIDPQALQNNPHAVYGQLMEQHKVTRAQNKQAAAQEALKTAAEIEKLNAEAAKLRGETGNGGLDTAKRAVIEGQLYDDLRNSPTTKEFTLVRDALRNVHSISKNKGGVFDIGNLYSFIKALDPNSSVREGEINLSQSAIPGLDRVALTYNKLSKGSVTTEELNRQIRQAISGLYDQKLKGYQAEKTGVAGRGQRYGLKEGYLPSLEIPQKEYGEIQAGLSSKPSVQDIVNQGKTQGLSRDAIKVQLRQAGY